MKDRLCAHSRNIAIKNQLYRIALLLALIFIISGYNYLCLADSTGPENSFGVSNHIKLLNKTITVFDGFLFHRYPNPFTNKIDNSRTITFTYTAEYKTINFATMTETIISSKTYTGSIPAGKDDSFLDLKKLMPDLGVKYYTGVIGVEITDSEGANCVGTGDAIDLRLVKVSIDAARQ